MPHPARPHIVVLCATRRGGEFLRKLVELVPQVRLTVFSFPEEATEPRYFQEIRELTHRHGGRFHSSRHPTAGPGSETWQEPVDAVFLVHWRYRVDADALNAACRSAFVFHDSLLPEYRGFSPTVWAVLNGEPRCGATLFRLAEEVDTGPIVDQVEVEIGQNETISELVPKVTSAYLELLDRHLTPILEGRVATRPQDETRATYTCRRAPEDNHIDWGRSTRHVHNLIRAVTHPYSGAYSYLDGKKVTIWSGRPSPNARRYVGGVPGGVAERRADGVVVLTGDGSLLVETVQLEDAAQAPAPEVLKRLESRLR